MFKIAKNRIGISCNISKNRVLNICKKKKDTMIDLFAGVGGLSEGLSKAGYTPIWANESDKEIAANYRKNHPGVIVDTRDIKNIKSSEIPDADLIAGGPSCQGFSIVGKKNIFDKRNQHIFEFARVVKDKKPKKFIMENVPRLGTVKNGKVLKSLKNKFEKAGYDVECKVYNASDFGVPQSRKRMICIGRRKIGEKKK